MMAFSPRNLTLVFIAFLATAYADSYIVDKETDETLVIVIAFFLVLAIVLFVLSIYFVCKYYRRSSDKTKTVSVKERNPVNPGQHVNPFQKHGKYSQKPSMYENIYLPHYETVIDPNPNEVYETMERKSIVETRRFDNVYLPGASSSSFRPQIEFDDGDYDFAYDPSESSDKEKRDYPALEEVQRDTQISESDGAITMTTVVTHDIVHSTSGPSNENHAYDSVDETYRV